MIATAGSAQPVTLEDVFGREIAMPRFNLALFGFFGFLGLSGSQLLARFVGSEVFREPGADPVSLGCVVLVLTLVALLACMVPARRASRLDPMSASRHE